MITNGIEHIVSIVSDNVVARLAAANYPDLVDGAILLGAQHVYEQSAPPRIIFIPTGSDFSEKDVYNRNLESELPYSAEAKIQLANRSIATELFTFQVRCWGVSDDHLEDFDMTRALYRAVILSIREVAGPFTAGGVEIQRGVWTDAASEVAQLIRHGREFVFGVTLPTPVPAELNQFASSSVSNTFTTIMQTRNGESSVGCGS